MKKPLPPDQETLMTWVSALLDGELAEEEEAILVQALEERAEKDPDDEVVRFFNHQIALGEAMALGPGALTDAESSKMLDAVMSGVAQGGDRVDLNALSAALDGEASAAEAFSTQGQASVEEGLHFAAAQEAVALALQAPQHWPEAEMAGKRALENLGSPIAPAANSAPAQVIPFAQRLRRWALPAVAAAAAVIALVIVGRPGTPQVGDAEWQAQVLASWEKILLEDGSPPENLPILGDNSETEILALGTDTDTAMVFSTPESQITVIWAPESLPENDAESAEQGT
jgi:hypothetical protein